MFTVEYRRYKLLLFQFFILRIAYSFHIQMNTSLSAFVFDFCHILLPFYPCVYVSLHPSHLTIQLHFLDCYYIISIPFIVCLCVCVFRCWCFCIDISINSENEIAILMDFIIVFIYIYM